MDAKIIGACALAAVAGCATPPNQIKAANVDASQYAGMGCTQLAETAIKLNSDIAPLVAAQEKTAYSDINGVIWLGVPVGSMTDKNAGKDREAEISSRKGELEAVQNTRIRKGCITG